MIPAICRIVLYMTSIPKGRSKGLWVRVMPKNELCVLSLKKIEYRYLSKETKAVIAEIVFKPVQEVWTLSATMEWLSVRFRER